MATIENRPAISSKLPPEIPLTPELLRIVDFLIQIGYNPNYQKDQEAIIKNLSTAPLEQALPQSVKAVYDLAINQQTPHLACELADQSVIKIDSGSNNIISVRQLKPEKRLFGIYRKFAVKNYFMVDQKSGKAWDVSQLWNDSGIVTDSPKKNQKPTQIDNLPDLFNAGSTMTNEGPTLILNRMSEHKKKSKLIKEIGQDGLEIVDNLIPIHESAHRVMYNRDSSKDNLESLFIKEYIAGITHKISEPIFRLAVAFSLWAGLEPEMYMIKHYVVETERNAHAFYLKTVRRLKELGIDINRNIPYQSVYKVINYTLGTYDKHSPVRFLPGLGYSQEVRKRQRLVERQKAQKSKVLSRYPSTIPAGLSPA